MVKRPTNDDINDIHEHNIDIKANHIYLFGEESYILPDSEGAEPGVEFAMANRFIKNLNILMRSSDEPILIHMKTCGGDWAEGMAIYDLIKACPNPITILNYTHARSMSSLIFCAADKRVMMPNSTFMFHDGTFSLDGTVKQAFTEIAELEKTNEVMYNIYIDKMKEKGKMKHKSRKAIKAWLRDLMDKKEEVYFDATSSVKYGFADAVFGVDGVYNWNSLLEFDDE
jgi:ATP-dependent protease ClpP protease subunit